MSLLQPEPPAARRRHAALGELLQQLAGRAHAAQLFVSFEQLHELSERLLARREFERARVRRRPRAALDGPAWRELVGSHAREQARLLRVALELVFWRTLEGRAWTACDVEAPCFEEWSEDASRELDAALTGGVSVPAELLVCCLYERAQWPAAHELARAAARLEAGPRGEVAELRAALARPGGERDLAAPEALLRAGLPLAEGARLHEALALAHERRGELELALDHHERSLAARPTARAALAGWVLAVERDDAARGELAWRALQATWRGASPLGPAREGRLWRELCELRDLVGPVLRESTRRGCEVALAGVLATSGRGA